MKKLNIILTVILAAILISCSSPVSTSDDEVESSQPSVTTEVTEETPTEEVPEETPVEEEEEEELPPEPTEDLVLPADNEYGIAYIYLPETDETTETLYQNEEGRNIFGSEIEYRLEFVKKVQAKPESRTEICTRSKTDFYSPRCKTLNLYKLYVSRNNVHTEFKICGATCVGRIEPKYIYYKVVKTDGNWYMSTCLNGDVSGLEDTVISQFTDDFEDVTE